MQMSWRFCLICAQKTSCLTLSYFLFLPSLDRRVTQVRTYFLWNHTREKNRSHQSNCWTCLVLLYLPSGCQRTHFRYRHVMAVQPIRPTCRATTPPRQSSLCASVCLGSFIAPPHWSSTWATRTSTARPPAAPSWWVHVLWSAMSFLHTSCVFFSSRAEVGLNVV